MRPTRLLLTAILILVTTSLFTGCLPGGGAGRPARKKMLNLDTRDESWESPGLNFPGTGLASSGAGPSGQTTSIGQAASPAPASPFTLLDTTITLGAETADFLLLRLPTTEMDYFLPMIKNYDTWLPVWLSSWPQLGRRGLALDLSAGTPTRRADFQLDCPAQHLSIPVVLLWDAASAPRAALITQVAQTLSTVQINNR